MRPPHRVRRRYIPDWFGDEPQNADNTYYGLFAGANTYATFTRLPRVTGAVIRYGGTGGTLTLWIWGQGAWGPDLVWA